MIHTPVLPEITRAHAMGCDLPLTPLTLGDIPLPYGGFGVKGTDPGALDALDALPQRRQKSL
jgi:hypothetical protein